MCCSIYLSYIYVFVLLVYLVSQFVCQLVNQLVVSQLISQFAKKYFLDSGCYTILKKVLNQFSFRHQTHIRMNNSYLTMLLIEKSDICITLPAATTTAYISPKFSKTKSYNPSSQSQKKELETTTTISPQTIPMQMRRQYFGITRKHDKRNIPHRSI